MTQPEALRLADWLEDQYDPTHNQAQAAAELRRLHIDNEACGIHLSERMIDLAKVEAQRDALLEALKEAVDVCGWPNVAFFHKALAAIKAAEENT